MRGARGRAARRVSGMRASACARGGSRRSPGWTSPLPCSRSWASARIPRRFEWFEAPSAARVEAALDLLRRLGALEGRRLTPLGEQLRHLPLPPRLGRVLLAAGGSRRAAVLCAVLAEPGTIRRSGPPLATDSDVLSMADELDRTRGFADRVARDLEAAASRLRLESARADDDASLRHALFLGYADRVAWRRAPGSARLLLASGTGAVLGRESGVVSGEFLVAHELGVLSASGGEAIVRTATRIEARVARAGDAREVVHRFEGGEVRAVERASLRSDPPGRATRPGRPGGRGTAPSRGALARVGLGPEAETLARRLRVAGLEVDLDGANGAKSCAGRDSAPRHRDAGAARRRRNARRLDRLAPAAAAGTQWPQPWRSSTARTARWPLSVKLQELFGLADKSARSGATSGAGAAAAPRAQRAPGADHTRSARLLEPYLPRGAQGAARPLPETRLARGSERGQVLN